MLLELYLLWKPYLYIFRLNVQHMLCFLCLTRSCIFATIKLWHYKHGVRLFPAWPKNTSASTLLSHCSHNRSTTWLRAYNVSCGSEIICPHGLVEDHPILPQISLENHSKVYEGGCGCSEESPKVLKAFWNCLCNIYWIK